jgi:uncharacterized membrane protein
MFGFKRFSRVGRVVPGTNLVPVPFAIAGAVMVMLAVTLVLDGLHGGRIVVLPQWLSVGDLDDARAILGALLGAVSTVLALIFSVTLLVFSMAVSQFGPRLMPYFLRDRTMQVTLGLFLASFQHCLITFVMVGQRGERVFVPQITVLTGIALVLFSFCYLVIYNNKVAQAIQTNNVLAHIVENLNQAISDLQQVRQIEKGDSETEREEEEVIDALRQRCFAEGGRVLATTSGYVQKIDQPHLVNVADRRGATIAFAFRAGQFVLEGEVLARVLPAEAAERLAPAVQGAVIIGQHRTLEQDIEFAFAQLSEIAIRALSPAINDTYTGLSCIDWLGDALRMVVAFSTPQGAWRTREGRVALLLPPPVLVHMVRAAFNLIREAGASSPAVTVRLLQTYARLAPQLHNDAQRQAFLEQVEAARDVMSRMPEVGLDRDALEAAYRAAREGLVAKASH